MNIKQTISLIILCGFSTLMSQTLNYDHRSEENPYYWKKSLPYSDYWQQDVHYKIDATIDDSLDIIDVPSYELIYWNNSPDTLYEIYFHLYQNAFQPNSYMHSLYLNNGKKVEFGKYEEQGLGTVYENLMVDHAAVKTELDNTVLKVQLNTPLLPQDSLTVSMAFKTYFDSGTLRRRMKMFEEHGSKHYDGVHWYPSICVYDKKFGWTTEQHMDKEFYADFGTFDINLTFPNDYIVEATGELTNENEVLPQELRNKIDLDNFKTKVSEVSTPVVRDGSTKTWKYHAINVHNFAFTADPKYRKRVQNWNGVNVVTLAMEQNAHKWQGSGDFAEQVTKVYSTDIGMYAWPKIVVADAKDGMEYPMITLDNGSYPGHQGLLAHEMGHMWFYGMVGSNETYRAMMDEGFTQFLTIWSLDKINGNKRDYKQLVTKKTKRKWLYNHLLPQENRYERLYYPYVKWILEGYDYQLNTHSSAFNGSVRHGGGYGLVYYKTGVMLYNLRYVLGEELFLSAMKHYFNTWKMKHPYPEDFRQSIIRHTKTDLNWFFDQWLETTKYIDYSVERVKAGNNKGEYEILFRRNGEMHMPIDFTVYTKSGKEIKYYIPNTWYQKKTDAEILTKWYGWDNIQPEYTAKITIDEEIENVVIDPERYLADVNLANNQWTKRYKFQFDHKVKNYPNWHATENFWRPALWYNAMDGIKAGLHIEGSYFKMLNRYNITGYYNTGLLSYGNYDNFKPQRFSFIGQFDQNLRKVWRGLESHENITTNAGVLKTEFGFTKRFKKQDLRSKNHSSLSISHKTLVRTSSEFENYNFIPNTWDANRWNNTIKIEHKKRFAFDKGNLDISTTLKTPGLFSDYNYTSLSVEAIKKHKLGKIDWKTRFYGQLGSRNTAKESSLYLAGANSEDLYDDKYTRAEGIIPNEWTTLDKSFGHFSNGGGLFLRAFAGTTISADNNTEYTFGNTGAGLNTELHFGNYFKLKKKLKNYLAFSPYLFGDAGTLLVSTNNNRFDQVLYDAGIGLETTIKFYYLDIKPLIIRAEIPLAMSNKNELNGFNFVLGIGKSF